MPKPPIMVINDVTIALPFTNYLALFSFDVLCLLSALLITQQLIRDGGVRDAKTFMRKNNTKQVIVITWSIYIGITCAIAYMILLTIRGTA